MDVTKANVKNIYQLTPLQEGMLFHALLEADSSAYFQQLSCEIRGHLDLAQFAESWNELVRRHEVLRSVFIHEGTDRPLQIVLKERKVDLTVVDLHQNPRDPAVLIEEFKAAERARPFDLSRDLLLRVAVLSFGSDRYEFIWSHHHIILDGWSVSLLLGELLEIYNATRSGNRPTLAPVTPFSRYIKWLEAKDREASVRFWRTALEGYAQRLGIPFSREKQSENFSEHDTFTFAIEKDATEKLHVLTARLGITLYTALQTAWALLLARYNGVSDVVFGSVVSGRSPEIFGVERMIGNFINTIPVRVKIHPELTFAQLLAQVQQNALAAEPHHYLPLSRVQAESGLHEGLFDTLVAFANYPVETRVDALGDVSKYGFRIGKASHFEQTHYDFDLQFLLTDQLHIRIGYEKHLYDEAQIHRAAKHFRAVLDAMLANECALIGSVDFLTDHERQRILKLLSGPRAPYSTELSLTQLFEQQVRRTPEQVSVKAGALCLSYDELNEQANRLAHQLREAYHIGPDERVGLLLDRDVGMIVGMLAVLKAGGSYVPIEASLPADRIRYVLTNSDCRIVLTSPTTYSLAKEVTTKPIVNLAAIPDGPAADLLPSANGQSLAYVIYTSGSTGHPKGVMIEHHSVVNLVQGLRQHLYAKHEEPLTVALIASYSFDASVQQIFATLLLGHTLVIVDDATKRDGQTLNQFLLEHAVDVIDGTPTLLQLMVQAKGFAEVRQRVKHALIGGEALPWPLLRQIAEVPGVMQISNVYGPTECCVDATAYLVDHVSEHAKNAALIGHPLANVQVVVLDNMGHLADAGISGEICILGPGVGRGYLNDPALTAQKFVHCPFAPQELMYRTADAGRWLPDGSLEFLGRLDSQVKVRGYRIELEEIEHHLRQHPSIARAAVAVQRSAGREEIHAYIVSPSHLTVEELRIHLGRTLPDYMIPARFLQVEDLPRTLSGKLDRNALVHLESEVSLDLGSDYLPPANLVERRLAEVWQDVLGHERVGVNDNYFALGGDSIKAIQLLSRLLRHQLKFAIRDLFRYPTIRSLAPHVVDVTHARMREQDVQHADCPLTAIQAQFFAEHTVEPHRFNHAVLLRARNRLDVDAVRQVFTSLWNLHDSLRLTFHQLSTEGKERSKSWMQRVTAVGEEKREVEVVDLRTSLGALKDMEQHAATLQGSFDLSTGPLLKFVIFRMAEVDRLLILAHHLCLDGVSWRILFEDFIEAYTCALAGQSIQLVRPSDSYTSWAAALSRYSRSTELFAEIPYWRDLERLALTLTSDEERTGAAYYRDLDRISATFSKAETAALLTEVNRAYNTTPEDILLTSLARTLHAWRGCSQTVISLEGHGREDILPGVDVSHTVGWFTSMYPFLLAIDPERNLGYQIKSIKECLRSIPNKGVGYGILRYLTPPDMAERPHFTVQPRLRFNYLGQIDGALDAGLFQFEQALLGEAVSPDALCPVDLDVSGMIVDDRLELTVAYNKIHFAEKALLSFLNEFQRQVRLVISHCQDQKHTELTPTDLSYSKISIDELEDIFS